jgi:hypothetical protein
MAAVPAHADTLPHFPALNARADGIDDAGNFVSGNARVRYAGARAFFGVFIAVADATGLDFYAHRSGGGFGDFALDELERLFCFWDLEDAHLGHDFSEASLYCDSNNGWKALQHWIQLAGFNIFQD